MNVLGLLFYKAEVSDNKYLYAQHYTCVVNDNMLLHLINYNNNNYSINVTINTFGERTIFGKELLNSKTIEGPWASTIEDALLKLISIMDNNDISIIPQNTMDLLNIKDILE